MLKELDILTPYDIGKWVNYDTYFDEEQLLDQKKHLISLDLENSLGQIKFIYSKYIKDINDRIDELYPQIQLEDTETIICDEVYYTSKIEGCHTTRLRTFEIHNGSPIKEDDKYHELMIKNGFEAVKLLNLYGNKLNEDKLFKVWETLTKGCCDNIEIKGINNSYRSDIVGIGNANGIVFEGAKVKDIPNFMNKWLNFYNSSKYDEYPFIKAAILHFTFETIHPFPDGNGRLGRLLMNNYLIGRGIDSAKAVSFSMQIDKKRALYDAAFIDGENSLNDCTPFIEYMLLTIYKTYQYALNKQQEQKIIKD